MKSGAPALGSGSGPFDRGRHSFRPRLVQDKSESANWYERHRALLAAHRERFAGTSVIQRLPGQKQREALLAALRK
jgi:hypothetical protein